MPAPVWATVKLSPLGRSATASSALLTSIPTNTASAITLSSSGLPPVLVECGLVRPFQLFELWSPGSVDAATLAHPRSRSTLGGIDGLPRPPLLYPRLQTQGGIGRRGRFFLISPSPSGKGLGVRVFTFARICCQERRVVSPPCIPESICRMVVKSTNSCRRSDMIRTDFGQSLTPGPFPNGEGEPQKQYSRRPIPLTPFPRGKGEQNAILRIARASGKLHEKLQEPT